VRKRKPVTASARAASRSCRTPALEEGRRDGFWTTCASWTWTPG